jgi:hypothetical protein
MRSGIVLALPSYFRDERVPHTDEPFLTGLARCHEGHTDLGNNEVQEG